MNDQFLNHRRASQNSHHSLASSISGGNNSVGHLSLGSNASNHSVGGALLNNSTGSNHNQEYPVVALQHQVNADDYTAHHHSGKISPGAVNTAAAGSTGSTGQQLHSSLAGSFVHGGGLDALKQIATTGGSGTAGVINTDKGINKDININITGKSISNSKSIATVGAGTTSTSNNIANLETLLGRAVSASASASASASDSAQQQQLDNNKMTTAEDNEQVQVQDQGQDNKDAITGAGTAAGTATDEPEGEQEDDDVEMPPLPGTSAAPTTENTSEEAAPASAPAPSPSQVQAQAQVQSAPAPAPAPAPTVASLSTSNISSAASNISSAASNNPINPINRSPSALAILLQTKRSQRGRKSDPRMERAVIAKLSNPGLTLQQALVKGGFVFRSKITGLPVGMGALNSLGGGDSATRRTKGKGNKGGSKGSGGDLKETADQIVDQDGMSLILRKNNLCGRIRRAKKMLNLGSDDDYAAAAAVAAAASSSAAGGNANLQQDMHGMQNVPTGTGTGTGTGLAGLGLASFQQQQQQYQQQEANTITSNQINKYLLDQQSQSQSQSHTNFFPTQNPSYAAQPSSSSAGFGGQQQHHQDSSSSSDSNNAEQLLQQLLQQQVDLQNQINAQMQLNAATANNSSNAQQQAQPQSQQSSSLTSYHYNQQQQHQQHQSGDSDLLNLWQQINADVSNLDNSIANTTNVNSNQFVTTPGIANFLAGNEGLGAVVAATAPTPAAASFLQQQQQQSMQQQLPTAANSTQELARFLMQNAEQDSFDVTLRNMPMSMAGTSTGALGAAGASSLFGGNAGWSSANISNLAAQANANIMANLNDGSNAAAAGSGGNATAAGLGMLGRRSSGSGSGSGSGGGY